MNLHNPHVRRSFFLFIMCLLGVFSYASHAEAAYSGAGTGTDLDPYVVTTCDQFEEIEDDLTASYLLNTDIDCTLEGNDIMVGVSDVFAGTFDGGDKTITVSLSLSGEDNIGLFREADGATIRNLTVSGVIETNADNVGLVGGRIDDTTISDLHSTGSVSSTGIFIGGLFGFTECDGTIDDSSSSADVSGTDYVGGISGYDYCDYTGYVYTDSFATGDIEGMNDVGGFVGYTDSTQMTNVYATGDVSGNDYVGGFAGEYRNFDFGKKIFHAHAEGTVSGRDYLGGFIGVSDAGIISQSYATGDVEGTGNRAGGFIGSADDEVTIRDSYSRGDIALSDEGTAGGFAGELIDTRISNSYSTGAPTNTGDILKGGFAGDATSSTRNNTVSRSFWDTETSGMDVGCWSDDDCGAIAKTTAELKTENTFTNKHWNFDTIWGIDGTNDGYPHLLGGDDEIFDDSQKEGPTETILGESQFHNTGEAQGWNTDDNHWEYDLPFDFYFYGDFYDKVYVNSNGYISFLDEGNIDEYNFTLEDGIETPTIFALGNDLLTYVNEGDDIYIEDTGDMVIFRWQATDYNNYDSISNFEIVLHKDSSFEFNYGDQTEPLNDESSAGVHDGERSYVASEYNKRMDFDELNTAAWEWDRVPSQHHGSSGGYASSAYLAQHGISLAQNPAPVVVSPVTVPNVEKGMPCPPGEILTQDLKTGARNGFYNSYTKGMVTQAHILQAHLNRLGFNSGAADGILGPISDGAIKRMQASLGTLADGYVGPLTRALLNNSCKL